VIGYKFVSNVLEADTIQYNNTKHYGGLVMELAFFRRKPQNAYRRQLRACTYCKYRSQKFMIWYIQTDYTALLYSSIDLQQYTFRVSLLTFFFSYKPIQLFCIRIFYGRSGPLRSGWKFLLNVGEYPADSNLPHSRRQHSTYLKSVYIQHSPFKTCFPIFRRVRKITKGYY